MDNEACYICGRNLYVPRPTFTNLKMLLGQVNLCKIALHIYIRDFMISPLCIVASTQPVAPFQLECLTDIYTLADSFVFSAANMNLIMGIQYLSCLSN